MLLYFYSEMSYSDVSRPTLAFLFHAKQKKHFFLLFISQTKTKQKKLSKTDLHFGPNW